MRRFHKEARTARAKMPLEKLVEAKARAEERLGIMKQAGVFPPDFLKDVEESVKDYDHSISRREAAIKRQARANVKLAFIAATLGG